MPKFQFQQKRTTACWYLNKTSLLKKMHTNLKIFSLPSARFGALESAMKSLLTKPGSCSVRILER